MKTKHKALVAVLVVVCIVLAGVGAYAYHNRPKNTGETLSQALTAQKTEENELKIMQAVDGANINNLKASNAQLTTTNSALSAQKTAACALLTAHRYTSPACTP